MIKSITRRKATMWQVYGRRDGKKSYVGTYASEIEARAAERRHAVTQEQIAAGELPAELDLEVRFRRPLFWDEAAAILRRGEAEYLCATADDRIAGEGVVRHLTRAA